MLHALLPVLCSNDSSQQMPGARQFAVQQIGGHVCIQGVFQVLALGLLSSALYCIIEPLHLCLCSLWEFTHLLNNSRCNVYNWCLWGFLNCPSKRKPFNKKRNLYGKLGYLFGLCTCLHILAAQCWGLYCTCNCSYSSYCWKSVFCLVCLKFSACIAQDCQVLKFKSHFPVTVGPDIFWSIRQCSAGAWQRWV